MYKKGHRVPPYRGATVFILCARVGSHNRNKPSTYPSHQMPHVPKTKSTPSRKLWNNVLCPSQMEQNDSLRMKYRETIIPLSYTPLSNSPQTIGLWRALNTNKRWPRLYEIDNLPHRIHQPVKTKQKLYTGKLVGTNTKINNLHLNFERFFE